MFESRLLVAELVNMQKAKEMASVLTMGLQDAWRRVHQEPEVREEVGATRENCASIECSYRHA